MTYPYPFLSPFHHTTSFTSFPSTQYQSATTYQCTNIRRDEQQRVNDAVGRSIEFASNFDLSSLISQMERIRSRNDCSKTIVLWEHVGFWNAKIRIEFAKYFGFEAYPPRLNDFELAEWLRKAFRVGMMAIIRNRVMKIKYSYSGEPQDLKVGGFDLGVSEVQELLLLILHLKENRKLLTAHDVSLIIYDFFDNGRKSLLSRVCESLLGMCEREILQGMAQEVLKMMSMKIVEKEWGNRNDNPQTREIQNAISKCRANYRSNKEKKQRRYTSS